MNRIDIDFENELVLFEFDSEHSLRVEILKDKKVAITFFSKHKRVTLNIADFTYKYYDLYNSIINMSEKTEVAVMIEYIFKNIEIILAVMRLINGYYYSMPVSGIERPTNLSIVMTTFVTLLRDKKKDLLAHKITTV